MKAVVVRAFGSNVSHSEFADPQPKAGEILVNVEAAEANYPDLLVIDGHYQVRPALPFVPGKGAAGRIAALGDGVTGLTVGQAVAAQCEYGAYAEKLVVPACQCYPIPDDVSFVEAAAAVLTYQTAWFALTDRARLQKGESVLVLGAAGGVGIATIQLAKALGAGVTIAGTRGANKLDAIRQAGADEVVDLSQSNLRDVLRDDIYRITKGKGVDIVVDPIGGAVFEPALRSLAWCGRHIIVGFAGGDIPVARANYLLVKNIAIMGLQASDYRDKVPERASAAQAEIFEMIRRGDFRPVVSETLPLRDFSKALDKLRRGTVKGKIILTTR